MNRSETVINKLVVEDKKFVVVKFDTQFGIKFGTVDYDFLDEEGKMIKPLNGLEMMVEDTLEKAVATRQHHVKTDRLIKEYMEEHDCSVDVAIMYVYRDLV